jgi:hypothetical protein
MTVKELKLALDKYDDDAIVVVRGYEEGVDEVRNITIGYCSKENPNCASWEGARSFEEKKNSFYTDKAIHLRA